jgi:ketosteroid isomerase-like protein
MNVIAGGATVLIAAALTAACSTMTGGAPVSQHATISSPASNPSNSAGTAPPSGAVSDEDQVRQAVKAFQDAYNTENWDAYLDVMCAPMRAKFTGTVMDYLRKGRAQTGATTVSATAVSVTGDTATVTMTSHNEAMGTRSVTLPLKREEDGWKICQL